MTKLTAFALLLASTLTASTGAACAQSGLMLPPSPAEQNAQAQAQIDRQNQQTQLNNLRTQQSNLENQLRQQQLFNSMPQPAYMLPMYAPPPRP